MLRPVIRSGGMPRPASAPRIGARAAGVRTEMPPASAGMADSCVGPAASASASASSAPAPAPAASGLGGVEDDKRRSRNRQQGRDRDDKPPEHGRLPRAAPAAPAAG